MGAGGEVAEPGLGLHAVRAQNVAAAGNQILFPKAEVGVTVRLIHGRFLPWTFVGPVAGHVLVAWGDACHNARTMSGAKHPEGE